MAIITAQMTAFFAEPVQMSLPAATCVAITQEGLERLANIFEFDEKSLTQITDNPRLPWGRVPGPEPNTAAGATIPTPNLVFGAKSQVCIKATFYISR